MDYLSCLKKVLFIKLKLLAMAPLLVSIIIIALPVSCIIRQEINDRYDEEIKQANRKRECSTPADPIRISMNDVLFHIPKNYPLTMSSWCKGWGTGCDPLPARKEFIEKNNSKVSFGYCQNPEDPPFILRGILGLNFTDKKIVKFNLTANEMPDIIHYFNRIEIRRDRNNKNINKIKENSAQSVTLFNNPVQIGCSEKNNGQGGCFVRAFVDDVYFINIYFKESEVPPEYRISYIKNLEQFLRGVMPDYKK